MSTWSGALASAYQYFPSSAQGGNIEVSDYCPYMLPYSNRICIDTANSGVRGDIYSSSSKCFESTVNGYSEGAACYQHSCSASGELSITLATSGSTTTVTCTTGGEQLSVSDGYVKYPDDITTVCAAPAGTP